VFVVQVRRGGTPQWAKVVGYPENEGKRSRIRFKHKKPIILRSKPERHVGDHNQQLGINWGRGQSKKKNKRRGARAGGLSRVAPPKEGGEADEKEIEKKELTQSIHDLPKRGNTGANMKRKKIKSEWWSAHRAVLLRYESKFW